MWAFDSQIVIYSHSASLRGRSRIVIHYSKSIEYLLPLVSSHNITIFKKILTNSPGNIFQFTSWISESQVLLRSKFDLCLQFVVNSDLLFKLPNSGKYKIYIFSFMHRLHVFEIVEKVFALQINFHSISYFIELSCSFHICSASLQEFLFEIFLKQLL